MESLLAQQYRQSTNAEASRLYADHQEVTAEQKARLSLRLERLGHQPSKEPGGFVTTLSTFGQAKSRRAMTPEWDAQELQASYVRAHLECAMYKALASQAAVLRDGPTSRLAARHLAQEERYAQKLLPYLRALTHVPHNHSARPLLRVAHA